MLVALCIPVLGFATWFLLWSLLPDGKISEYEFSVLGDSLHNLGGVAAVLVAGVAAYIAYQTNEARRLEASRANFKDRLQWAVEHLASDSNIEQVSALGILNNLASDPELESADNQLVSAVVASYKESLEEATSRRPVRSWKFRKIQR